MLLFIAASSSVLEVGGQAVLGRQLQTATPWLTERHGYDPTWLLAPDLPSSCYSVVCLHKVSIANPGLFRGQRCYFSSLPHQVY